MPSYDTQELLDSQLLYYRIDAGDMDAGIRRVLAKDSTEYADQFRRGTAEAVDFLTGVVSEKDTLEIAAGTGLYTERIASPAAQLTALDASPESIAMNRALAARSGHDIEFIVHDVFSWVPPRRYEAVVFTFWLSHVPLVRFEDFWTVVGRALAPSGTVAFVDAPAPHDAKLDPRTLTGAPDIVAEEYPDDGVTLRKRSDGQTFPIVRVLWPRAALRTRLEQLGWALEYPSDSLWLLGRASRISDRRRPGSRNA